MREKLKQLIQMRKNRLKIETEIADISKSRLEKIKKLQDEINDSTKSMKEVLAGVNSSIDRTESEILDNWDGTANESTIKIDGTKIVRRCVDKPKVLDESQLMFFLMTTIQDKDKMPFSPKWDNKKLLALIEVGIVSESLASIEHNYTLAVTLPKDNVEEKEPDNKHEGLGALFG